MTTTEKKVTIGRNGRVYPLGKDHFAYNPDLPHNKNPMGICECGCGEEIVKYHPGRVVTRFKRGHQYKSPDWGSWTYKWDRPWHNVELIECACGCGEKIPRYDNRGSEHKWKEGHHLEWLHKKCKGVLQGVRVPDTALKDHHTRLRRAKYYYLNYWGGKMQCHFYDKKICTKRIVMYFKDENDQNFDRDNIATLCQSHRALITFWGLDFSELDTVKADFGYDKNNPKKRRKWFRSRRGEYKETKPHYKQSLQATKVLSSEMGHFAGR